MRLFFILLLPVSLWANPKIECDSAMLQLARERIKSKAEPFHTYWTLARKDAQRNLASIPRPYTGDNSLDYHQQAQADGINARLLAYWWQLERNKEAGAKALDLLYQWANTAPLPGTTFSHEIRYPNSGMDVARATLPFVVTYDLLEDHPALTKEKREKIEHWFRALSRVVRTDTVPTQAPVSPTAISRSP